LQRELDNVNCLIGLSFTVNTLRPDHPMYVGIANIFDEFGEWVDITPDQRELSDMELKAWYESPYLFYSQETASSKLPREFTSAVIRKSVQSYKNRRGRDPLNIVIHKSGPIYQVEMEGILHGIKATGTPLPEITIGFVSLIQNHGFRMYGEPDSDWRDSCVVRRGVMCTLEADRILLATTGRTETSSHVLSTPQPLEIRVERPSPEGLESVGLDRVNQYSDAQLCEQLMALTQLHWGSMRREIRLPVTVLYSQKVASLSARAEITSLQEGRVHRPWFI
jgi:argonaute-like protein implicated in RNA metabolism and viral defense